MKNEALLERAPVWKLLVFLSVPTVIITMITVLYHLADTFFMGQTGDTLQVAAISLASPAFSVLSGLGTLLGMGGCTAISIALGQGQKERVQAVSSFCFWGALALGVLVAVGANLFMGPLVQLLGADSQTAPHTAAYLRIVLSAGPVLMVSNVLANIIRATGSVKHSLLSSLLGTGVNVALDPLFILGLGWGIQGAAVATVLGNAASALYLTVAAGRAEGFSLALRDFRLGRQSWQVLGLGLPMAASTLLMSFSNMFGNNLRMGYGSTVTAASSVASMAGMLVSMVAMGICMGVQPAMAYAFGAGKRARLHAIVRGTALATLLVGTALSGGIFLLREPFVAGFLSDPEVVRLGSFMVLGALAAGPFFGWYQLSSCYLQSTGKAGWATVVSLLRQGIVYIPALYGMNLLWGLEGLVFAGAASDLLSTAIAAALALRWARRLSGKGRAVPAVGG